MTILELLVVLTIGAAVVALTASSLQRPRESRSSFDDLVSLSAETRLRAATTGQAGLLIISADTMTDGVQSVSWGSDVTVEMPGGVPEGRIVFYGDGTTAGTAVRFVTKGRTTLNISPNRMSRPPALRP